jgi:CRP-like cAMP-binding protein
MLDEIFLVRFKTQFAPTSRAVTDCQLQACTEGCTVTEQELTVADFLDEKRREIEARMKELRPHVDEYHRLEAAAKALAGAQGSAAAAPASSGGSSSARRPLPKRSSPRTRRAGRPRGSGTRGNQALEIVRGQPGITIPEIAEKMGIQQNYLYRVLPGLAQDGLVEKKGRGWHPKAAA